VLDRPPRSGRLPRRLRSGRRAGANLPAHSGPSGARTSHGDILASGGSNAAGGTTMQAVGRAGGSGRAARRGPVPASRGGAPGMPTWRANLARHCGCIAGPSRERRLLVANANWHTVQPPNGIERRLARQHRVTPQLGGGRAPRRGPAPAAPGWRRRRPDRGRENSRFRREFVTRPGGRRRRAAAPQCPESEVRGVLRPVERQARNVGAGDERRSRRKCPAMREALGAKHFRRLTPTGRRSPPAPPRRRAWCARA